MSANPPTNSPARVNHSVRSTCDEPELVVPEHLGPDLGEEHQQHGEAGQHDEGGHERAAAAARGGSAGGPAWWCGEAHGVEVLVVDGSGPGGIDPGTG